MSESAARERESSIETLRGAAVLLLVSAHVIGLTHGAGMRVAAGSPLRHFTDSFTFVRMPLFTVISGYVYDLRPAFPGRLATFLRGKARRLLLPLMAVAPLQFLAEYAIPGVHHHVSIAKLVTIYVFPFDQFWFLQALMLVFIVVAWLDGRRQMRELRGWLVCEGLAVLACFFMPRPTTFFSYPSSLYLLPFFMLGLGLHRFGEGLLRPGVTRIALLALAVTCAAHQAILFGVYTLNVPQLHALGFAYGMVGCYTLVRFRRSWSWLAWLGSYSFPIFLFHVFAASGSRIAMERAGIAHPAIVLASGMAFGVLLPIAADRLLRRNRLTRLLFLGLSSRPAESTMLNTVPASAAASAPGPR